MDLVRKKNSELKPYTEKQRHPCPFYGFNGSFGAMIDSEGNQCAIITKSFSPCKMCLYHETPNWNKCSFNTEENKNRLIGILANIRIYPGEFKPSDSKNWRGLEFAEWADYVMK